MPVRIYLEFYQYKFIVYLQVLLTDTMDKKYSFIPEEERDTQYDYDYTKEKATGFSRGGRDFYRPYGWKKVALKVKGKYKDDNWFGPGSRGDEKQSVDGEWPVSYHGPKDHNTIPDIIKNGYDISKITRTMFGTGIYSSPYPETAEEYGESFKYEGKQIKVMFMNRVHMSCTKEVNGERYFVTTDDNQIRPIAVLIKENCSEDSDQKVQNNKYM